MLNCKTFEAMESECTFCPGKPSTNNLENRPNGWDVNTCKCAHFDAEDGRYECSVSGDGCMFIFPDSKRCAEIYGEGPDAVETKEEDEYENKRIDINQ